MIKFDSFTLNNGLKVLVHEDHATEIAVLNIMYQVGSRDEDPEKTGFAHLFEHLMFGGSVNIPDFDGPLQKVGGESNAFTSPDVTNYYITLPAVNIETAFWLESDRMLSLAFSAQSLEVQQKVVIEEFKQRYLNQPYGDVWLKLRPLAYQVHPYRWNTIGKDILHIEQATLDYVREFFYRFYRPNNAILVVAGNVTTAQIKKFAEKWFAEIPSGEEIVRNLPVEPIQTEARMLEVEAGVPLDAIYRTYHMPSRMDSDYHSADLVSDILGRGNSSRLYNQLLKEQKLFNSISSYVTGSIDPGLLVIQAKLNEGVGFNEAESAIDEVIGQLKSGSFDEGELQKVKNQAESTMLFSEVDLF